MEPELSENPAPQPAEEPAGPVPLLAGSFALYDDGQGGFILVTKTVQQGVNRAHIPRKLVKLGTALSGGKEGGGFFGRLVGGGG